MFYRVISNLEHNGVKYAPNSVVEEAEENFVSLVQDNIVKPLEDATSEEQAKVIIIAQIESEVKAKADAENEAVVADGENTWGPTPEKPEAPAPEEEKTEEAKTPDEVKTEETPVVAPGEAGTGDVAPTGDNL